MCNIGSANPTALVDSVADAILGEVAQRPAENVPPHADGLYLDASRNDLIRVTTKNGQTIIGPGPLYPRADGRYQLGHYRAIEFHDGAIDMSEADAPPHHYVPIKPPKPLNSAIAGRYHAGEVVADWTIAVRDGKAYASSDRFAEVELKPVYENAFDFASQLALFVVEFDKDGFTISDRGVTRLRFTRVR